MRVFRIGGVPRRPSLSPVSFGLTESPSPETARDHSALWGGGGDLTKLSERVTGLHVEICPSQRFAEMATSIAEMATSIAAGPSLTAYELERLENIRQNNLRLQELGLDAPPPSRAGASVRAPPKRKRPALSTEEPVERRRSLRQRVATVIYSDETPLPQTHSRAQPVERSRPYEAPEDDDQEDGAARESTAVQTDVAERPPPDAGSARAIELSVDAIMERHLGKPVSSTFTKAAAVEAITGRKKVSFSKYSGTLEWRNAILLWVNIGGADYRNVFFDGGARMTWYASPTNHEGTPVVRRLLAGKDAVLLFCRLQQEGSSEPYVCCGRLAYVSHDQSRQPLKFVWSLRDLEMLRKSADFRELLAAAD